MMKTKRLLVCALIALAFVVGWGGAAWADPPDRVGRIDLLSGTVSFHPGSIEEWAPATLNYPLTIGDNLWTDQDGEAEIHVGSTAIRLASNTEFSFLNLDDQTMQIRLSAGSLNIRLRQLEPGEVVEIDTPNASLTLVRPGSYRVDVQQTGDSSVTVRSGEAEVNAGDSSFSVFPQQMGDISGLDSPSYDLAAAYPPDQWDQWCDSRDRAEDHIVSAQYVPRDMIGIEDLDANGAWRVMPGYGPVWQPTVVPVGWAPYRYGHWAWVDPWGWTWIDDAPWGFAPFHYGRWASLGGSWVWVPGRIVARPVYAPALVVFVGGSGWAPSGGGVAWFPLGPREPYVPPYTVTNVYVRNVNISQVTVTNVQTINVTTYRYVNRSVPGAIVAVPNQAFVRAQPVNSAAFVVPGNAMERAPIRGTYAPVAPVRESVLGRAAVGPAPAPPQSVWSRPVIVRRAPPPPPVPFAARQQALDAHPGRPLDPGTLQTLRRESPEPGPRVIMRSPPPGNPQGPQRIQAGPGPQPGARVQPGPQPGPRVQPGPQPGPRVQPGPQPGPRMQGPQPGPRVQPGPQPGPRVQPGPQPQPGPREQPGMRRGPQGQVLPPGNGPAVRPPQGPRPNPGAGNDDLLKKKKPQDQGGQGQPRQGGN
jgi:Family of unknown function (DUF6600)/FecR protein